MPQKNFDCYVVRERGRFVVIDPAGNAVTRGYSMRRNADAAATQYLEWQQALAETAAICDGFVMA